MQEPLEKDEEFEPVREGGGCHTLRGRGSVLAKMQEPQEKEKSLPVCLCPGLRAHPPQQHALHAPPRPLEEQQELALNDEGHREFESERGV